MASPMVNGFYSGSHLKRRLLGNDRTHLQTVSALGESPDPLNPQHYISETSRSTPTRASTYQLGKFRSYSLTHQSVRTKNLSGSIAGQNSLRVGQNQKRNFVKPDKQMVQRRTSEWLRSTHMDRGFAQQAQMSQREEEKPPAMTNQNPLEMTTQNPLETTSQNPPETATQNPPEMTINRAVKFLDKRNDNELIFAAAWIQNQCLENDKARVEFHWEDGAGKLLQLLKSNNTRVQCVAAGALRNVVYKNRGNKKHVKYENGHTIILNLLNKTQDEDTKHQLAGLLWNLSSDDEIALLFDENVFNVLTNVILVPFSNRNEESKRDLIVNPKAFLCAIQCLLNLSSHCHHRKNMRQCENLLDSLVSFTTQSATKPRPDDKSTEICVCIFCNLTFEAEEDWIPQTTKDKGETQQTATTENKGETQQTATTENKGETQQTATTEDKGETQQTATTEDKGETQQTATTEDKGETQQTATTEDKGETQQTATTEDKGETQQTASSIIQAIENKGETQPTANTEDKGETQQTATTEDKGETQQTATTEDKGKTQQTATPKERTCSCFPYRPAKRRKDPEDKEKAEEKCPLQNSDNPRGAQWLWSDQLVRAYLSLLACSKNKITLTAAMGALQNLTLGKGEISEKVAKIIQEQNGLQKIKTLVENDNTLKKAALLLMRNLSRFPDLHDSILDNLLSKNYTKTFLWLLDISAEESSELMPVLCRILINLSKNNAKTASQLSREQEVINMLKEKHEGRAKQAVKELKYTLQKSSKNIKKIKPKCPKILFNHCYKRL